MSSLPAKSNVGATRAVHESGIRAGLARAGTLPGWRRRVGARQTSFASRPPHRPQWPGAPRLPDGRAAPRALSWRAPRGDPAGDRGIADLPMRLRPHRALLQPTSYTVRRDAEGCNTQPYTTRL